MAGMKLRGIAPTNNLVWRIEVAAGGSGSRRIQQSFPHRMAAPPRLLLCGGSDTSAFPQNGFAIGNLGGVKMDVNACSAFSNLNDDFDVCCPLPASRNFLVWGRG